MDNKRPTPNHEKSVTEPAALKGSRPWKKKRRIMLSIAKRSFL
jgi:hypothetical protein